MLIFEFFYRLFPSKSPYLGSYLNKASFNDISFNLEVDILRSVTGALAIPCRSG